MKSSIFSVALLSLTAGSAAAADILTYTDFSSEPGKIALGYTVPLPVDSLTPIDGFRSYQSLYARHQQLMADADFISGQIVGQSSEGEPIWMYSVSDADNLTQSGAPEAAVLINGGIHAREWQSPEAVTGFVEQLYTHRDDGYIESYLVDNLNMHFIPVLNVDGFKQSQRYPTQVTESEAQPRDGRMRRKNMRDVDNQLSTFEDNRFGVDLNRNNAPYWASNDSSSADLDSLIYHGTGPGSEPETQALYKAATLAPAQRLRLFVDVHSFSRIYYTPMTGNARRDGYAHLLVTIMRSANNFKYDYGPGVAGNGIGTTAEYFADNFSIPSATLELEPSPQGATDYGGFGISHDGFILPNSQVRRMVKEATTATLAGFYTLAEKPMLQRIRIADSNGVILVDGQWQKSADGRQLTFAQNEPLAANADYQVSLTFNKPMRWVGESGQISHFPSTITHLQPIVQWQGKDNADNDVIVDANINDGQWPLQSSEQQSGGYAHYQTDTFTFTTHLADQLNWQNLKRLALTVDVTDMVNQPLDANPATIADWQNGQWTNYENGNGENGDTGGLDKSFRLIDDGSDLFEPDSSGGGSPSTPSTPAQSGSSGGGGGSFGWLLMWFVIARWYRHRSARYHLEDQTVKI